MTESPHVLYARAFAGRTEWIATFEARIARLEAGRLAPRLRELVYVVGYLVNDLPEAARWHQRRAVDHGAAPGDFQRILQILDFYRGLQGFQDAQKLISLWRSGNFPEVKPAEGITVAEILAQIIQSRKYIANGFRVYGADGEWLKLYLRRSDAIKATPGTLDERETQLLSMAITLENHGYSGNWNDGCIQVHEDKARALGASESEVLEVVQILEVCRSLATASLGLRCLALPGA